MGLLPTFFEDTSLPCSHSAGQLLAAALLYMRCKGGSTSWSAVSGTRQAAGLQLPSQKMAGAPNVYVGLVATAGSTPRRRYMTSSSVARLPPRLCPCRRHSASWSKTAPH